MAAIPGSVRFTGFIAPTDTTDVYPVTDPTWGLGGLRRVSGTTERDLISTGRRENGMLVFSEGDDTYYKLGSGLTNSDWSVFMTGGGSGNYLDLSGGTVTGVTSFTAGITSTAFSGGTYFSGGTDLYDIFNHTSANLWSASTGTNSIIANNGTGNLASGSYAFAGGYKGVSSGNYSLSLGGYYNDATNTNSSTIGGVSNTASGNRSSVFGGLSNLASGENSSIVGGSINSATTENSSIIGGKGNYIKPQTGGLFANRAYSIIGSYNSTIAGNYSSIVGGRSHYITNPDSFVGGGAYNTIDGNGSSIVGGFGNTISVSASQSFIGGSSGSTVSGTRSAVIGGSGLTNTFDDTLMTANARLAESGGVIYSAGTDLYSIISGATSASTQNLAQVLAVSGSTGGNDIFVNTGDTISSDNGYNFLNLDTIGFGLDLGVSLVYSGVNYLSTFQAVSALNLSKEGAYINHVYEDAGANKVSTSISSSKNAISNSAVSIGLTNSDPSNRMWGEIGMVDNRDGDRTIAWNLYPTADMFPSVVSSQNSTFKQGVYNTSALGGDGISAKTNNTAYVNKLGYSINSEAFELLVSASTPTVDRIQTHQDASGVIALLSDLTGFTSGNTLADTLAIGNTTSGNNIVMSVDDVISGPFTGSTKINLNSTIFNDSGLPTRTLNGATLTPVGLTGFSYTTLFDWTGILSIGDVLQVNGTQGGVNDGVHIITGIYFNSPNTEIQWSGMTADTNSPYGEWAREGDGTEWIIGSTNSRVFDYATQFGISTDRPSLSFQNTNTGGTVNLGNWNGANISLSTQLTASLWDISGFSRFGEISMFNNLTGDTSTINFAPNFPTAISSINATLKQSVYNTVVLGGENIIAKNNNTAYLNQLGYNYSGAYDTIISAVTPTADRIQTHQDASGVIALLSDISAGGSFLDLSGGTVTGDTVFTQGVSADTIYVTTTTEAPLNLPVLSTVFTSSTHGDVWISSDHSSGTTLFNMVVSGVTKSVEMNN